jgi:hypothetical protein
MVEIDSLKLREHFRGDLYMTLDAVGLESAIREDLPKAQAALSESHPGVTIDVMKNVTQSTSLTNGAVKDGSAWPNFFILVTDSTEPTPANVAIIPVIYKLHLEHQEQANV